MTDIPLNCLSPQLAPWNNRAFQACKSVARWQLTHLAVLAWLYKPWVIEIQERVTGTPVERRRRTTIEIDCVKLPLNSRGSYITSEWRVWVRLAQTVQVANSRDLWPCRSRYSRSAYPSSMFVRLLLHRLEWHRRNRQYCYAGNVKNIAPSLLLVLLIVLVLLFSISTIEKR